MSNAIGRGMDRALSEGATNHPRRMNGCISVRTVVATHLRLEWPRRYAKIDERCRTGNDDDRHPALNGLEIFHVLPVIRLRNTVAPQSLDPGDSECCPRSC